MHFESECYLRPWESGEYYFRIKLIKDILGILNIKCCYWIKMKSKSKQIANHLYIITILYTLESVTLAALTWNLADGAVSFLFSLVLTLALEFPNDSYR